MARRSDIKAGGGYVELRVEKTELEKGLEEAKKSVQNFGKTIGAIGAGIAAAGAAITAPFLKGLNVFSELGKETLKASRETGIGFEQMGTLAAALGGDIQDTVATIIKMDTFLEKAAQGGEEANRVLGMLGVSFADLNQADTHERMLMIADALEKVGDAGQRAALKREIFGRGAAGTNLSGGRAGITAREARAAEVGGVISEADKQTVFAYNKALKEMGMATKGIWLELGAAAAPFMTRFYNMVVDILIQVRQWLNSLRPVMEIVFRIGDGMVTAGAVIAGIGGAIFTIGSVLPLLATAVGAAFIMFAKVAVVVGAIALAAYAVYTYWDDIVSVAQAIGEYLSPVGEYFAAWGPILQEFWALFSQIWGGITDAISGGDLKVAFQVAWLGVQMIWAKGVNWMRDGFFSLGYVLNVTFDSIVKNIAKAMVWVSARIVDAINGLIDLLPDWVQSTTGITRLGSIDETEMNRQLDRDQSAAERRYASMMNSERARAAGEEGGLQGEMDYLRAEAETVAIVADTARAMRNVREQDGRPGGFTLGGNASSVASTSTAALAFMGNGVSMIEKLEEGNQIQRDIRDELRGMEGLVAT